MLATALLKMDMMFVIIQKSFGVQSKGSDQAKRNHFLMKGNRVHSNGKRLVFLQWFKNWI